MRMFLLFFLISQIIFAQNDAEKLIHGKIVVASGNSEGVNIINLVNEKSTTSDSNGEFYILAKDEDLLVFSSVSLEYYRKIIQKEDLKSDVLIINMMDKVTELKEVVVKKYPEINAVSLGVSPAGIKKYTPAERKLITAEEFHWYSPLLIPIGGMSVDGMINSISGRTTMLKKELEVEKKERLLLYLNTVFNEEYYVKTLKIPSEYIKGFHYFCIENQNLNEAIKTKNKIKLQFEMVQLANTYIQVICSEK